MKKIFIIITISLLFLSGCQSENYSNPEDNKYVITSSEVKATESITESKANEMTTIKKPMSYREIQEAEYNKKVNQLFTAFIEGDKETLMVLSGARSASVFEFIDNIKFNGFKIESDILIEGSNETDFGKVYSVIISVDKSSDSRFPIGESKWEVSLFPLLDGTAFSSLRMVGENVDKISDIKLSENAQFCYTLTVEMEPYIGRLSRFKFSIPDDNKAEFHGSLANFFSKIRLDDPIERSPKSYNTAAKEIFGMDTDFTDENINSVWHGAYIKEAVLVSETENEIIIDYYADSLLLTKAFTIKYTLDDTDGIKLISIENLYDSGFEAASYST